MSSIHISVVIPTRNRPALLREALYSVSKQSRVPQEVLVSDNFTKTPCTEVVREFKDLLPIRRVTPPQDMVMESHWIWALKQASHEYIALLEDDNLWHFNHLEVLESAVRVRPQCGLFGTATRIFEKLNSSLHRNLFAPIWSVNLLECDPVHISAAATLGTYLYCTPIASSAVMVSRSVLQGIHAREEPSPYGRDRWYWCQFGASDGCVFSPHTTVLYRSHEHQCVKQIPKDDYRLESSKTTLLIMELIQREGYSIQEVVDAMKMVTEPTCLNSYLNEVFRQRDFKKLFPRIHPLLGRGLLRSTPLIIGAILNLALIKLQKLIQRMCGSL